MILNSSLIFLPRANRPKGDTTKSANHIPAMLSFLFRVVRPTIRSVLRTCGPRTCPSLSRMISLTEMTALIAVSVGAAVSVGTKKDDAFGVESFHDILNTLPQKVFALMGH